MQKLFLKKSIKGLLSFGAVGTIGFIVDTAVLYLISGTVGLFSGRIISFSIAVFTTWLLNKKYTFHGRESGFKAHKEFTLYFSLMIFGGALNFLTYSLLIITYKSILQNPIIAVAFGSLAGMCINFISSRFLLYRY